MRRSHIVIISVFLISSITFCLFFYQMDFRAFYTAGKSIILGLNPYMNNELEGLIDACEQRNVSRFIYPPGAAYFFTFFSFFTYPIAKLIWTLVLILCAWYIFSINKDALILLISFPILFAIERGQIDLLIIVLLISAYKSRSFLISIFLFFLTVTLKLFPILLIPFFWYRWKSELDFKKILGFLSLSIIFLLAPSFKQNLDYIDFFRHRPNLDFTTSYILDSCYRSSHFINLANYRYIFNENLIHGQLNALAFFENSRLIGLIILIAITVALVYNRVRFNYNTFLFYIPTLHILNDKLWVMTIVYFLPFILYNWQHLSNKFRRTIILIMFFPPLEYLELIIFPILLIINYFILTNNNDSPSLYN